MNANDTWQPLLGRILLAAIFLVSGFGKITGFGGTAQFMASKGMPMVPLLLTGTIVVEIVGGLFVMAGYKTRYAALALLAFTVAATVIFHDFWALSGPEQAAQRIHFMKNLSIIGGLLVVMGLGAGRWSADGRAA